MRKLLLSFFCIASLWTYAQDKNGKSIEASLLARWDKHAHYTTRFGNRSYSEEVQLAGLSFGGNIAYRYQLGRNLYTRAALGIYRLRIDQVRNTSRFGTATVRNIDYQSPDSTKPLYSTGKYHYNNLSFSVGVQGVFPLKQNLQFTTGADLVYYYTFSQKYHMSWNKIYKPTHARTLGFGLNTQAGILKEFERFYIQPQIIIPVYQQLRGDKVFGEDESMAIPKWFNGVGALITVGKYL